MKKLFYILAICFSMSFAVSKGHELKNETVVSVSELHSISTNAP